MLRIRTTQRFMVRKMMHSKRLVNAESEYEPWLEWHKRTMKNAIAVVYKYEGCIINTLATKRHSWASHIARMGIFPKSQHLLKAVLFWRNLTWWKEQQLWNELGVDELRHGYFRPRRWESQFPLNWMHAFSQ